MKIKWWPLLNLPAARVQWSRRRLQNKIFGVIPSRRNSNFVSKSWVKTWWWGLRPEYFIYFMESNPKESIDCRYVYVLLKPTLSALCVGRLPTGPDQPAAISSKTLSQVINKLGEDPQQGRAIFNYFQKLIKVFGSKWTQYVWHVCTYTCSREQVCGPFFVARSPLCEEHAMKFEFCCVQSCYLTGMAWW